MKKILICAFVILISFPVMLYASGIGTVTYVEGRVDVSKDDSGMAVPIREGDEISVGDIIRTKSNSKAEVNFNDNSKLRLASNSRVEIKDYELDKDNNRIAATIKLERGKIRTIIEKTSSSGEFNILTPNAEGTVKGSDIFAFYHAGASGMLVAEGKLAIKSLTHPEDAVIIHAGSSAFVSLEGLPSGPRPYLELEKKLHEQDTSVPFAAPKKGESTLIKGVFVNIFGTVKITKKGTSIPHNAGYNEIVDEGDTVETGDDGSAEIKFDNGCGLSLRQNTHVTMTRLVIDPKTGEYQNLFDASKGKIKGRIENLKGKSTFEVKTPVAICGARATIMYVDITPAMTKAFFEGGNGYIMNLISSVETDIDIGHSGSANGQGFNSTPTPPSDQERFDWTQGWDSGSDTAGYSPSDANDNLNAPANTGSGSDDDPDRGRGSRRDDTADDANFNIYLPPAPNTPSSGTTLPAMGLAGAFGGTGRNRNEDFGYYDEYSETGGSVIFDSGAVEGSIYGEGDLWHLPIPFSVLAEYSNPESRRLWRAEPISGLTSDGARYFGVMGGVVDTITHSVEALLVAIYIRPDGGIYRAGFIRSSDIAGNIFPYSDPDTSGLLGLAGNMESYLDVPTAIPPEELYDDSPALIRDDIIPGLISGETFSGRLEGESLHLEDHDWDIWRAGAGGNYTSLPGDNWHAVVGGFETDDPYGESYWDGYYIAHITGDRWQDNKLSGTIRGRSINFETSGRMEYDDMAIIDGDLIGSYDETSWQGLSAGATISHPLRFGGKVEGNFGYYESDLEYPADSMLYLEEGAFSFLFGGETPLWVPSSQIVIIGEFSGDEDYKLWGRDYFSGVTKDGGVLLGYVGGTKLNDILKGILAAIYVRPDGGDGYLAGYVRSNDINGEFYPGIGMFEAAGTLGAGFEFPTEFSPSDLYDGSPAVHKGIDNNTSNAGLIFGDGLQGTISPEDMRLEGQDWGVWRCGSGGTYSSLPGVNWRADMGGSSADTFFGEINSYWKGIVSGPEAWADNSFFGTIAGSTLNMDTIQNIYGHTVGVYGDGMWESYGVGVYMTEVTLSSSGKFVAYGWDVELDFDFAGLVGLVGPMWDEGATPQFVSIGEFNSAGQQQFMWGSVKDGEREALFYSMYYIYGEGLEYRYTTYDDGSGEGAFAGLSAGVGGSGGLKGLVYALYLDPAGDAGVIHGEIGGTYSDGADIYKIGGILAKDNPRISGTEILPEDLYTNNLSWSNLFGLNDHGGFDNGYETGDVYAESGSGTMLNITGQNWGVWNVLTSGTYEGPTSDIWDVYDLTGTVTTAEDSEVGGAWLGGITGRKWSDNELKGRLDAVWIELHKDGTLSGRTANGETLGNYLDVEEGSTWRAASAGEWVEVNTDLILSGEGLDANMIALGEAANIPITVAHSSVMSGSGGEILSMTMDTHLYTMASSMADGIWAAAISGYYSTAPATDWTVTVTSEAGSATLTGPAWSGGQWAADVSGSVGGAAIAGQAAGTYGEGAFEGAATGTFGSAE